MTETVDHFVFHFPQRVAFPFKDDNKQASGIETATKYPWASVINYTWDVYRFGTAATGEWLRPWVAHKYDPLRFNLPQSMLHS